MYPNHYPMNYDYSYHEEENNPYEENNSYHSEYDERQLGGFPSSFPPFFPPMFPTPGQGPGIGPGPGGQAKEQERQRHHRQALFRLRRKHLRLIQAVLEDVCLDLPMYG